jgi:glycerophosphoryl diester phosphodiesterase
MNPWLIAAISLFALVLLFAVLYLVLMKPCTKRGGLEKYSGVRFAHRGLHNESIPENSLGAFRLAVEGGFGIELDVHAAADGVPVVFHDGTLERMVGIEGKISDYTSAELSEMRLLGTDEKIPLFSEVLSLIGGKIPLLVELKQDGDEVGVAEAAAALLRDYEGDYIVESFNPFTLAEFAKKLPEVRRGILSQKFTDNPKHRSAKYYIAQNLLLNRVCKPDFIAFRHSNADFLPFKIVKALYKPTTVAWTVRSHDEERAAFENGFDSVIFENYIP